MKDIHKWMLNPFLENSSELAVILANMTEKVIAIFTHEMLKLDFFIQHRSVQNKARIPLQELPPTS